MTSLFQSLTKSLGLSSHVAWRTAFVIVPVPILLFIAGSTLIFGQDHPFGRWENRLVHPDIVYLEKDRGATFDNDKKSADLQNGNELEKASANPSVGTPVKGSFTFVTYFRILASPLTWLTPLAYMTSFGLELAIDSNFANILFSLFNKKRPRFGQTQAGYYTSIL